MRISVMAGWDLFFHFCIIYSGDYMPNPYDFFWQVDQSLCLEFEVCTWIEIFFIDEYCISVGTILLYFVYRYLIFVSLHYTRMNRNKFGVYMTLYNLSRLYIFVAYLHKMDGIWADARSSVFIILWSFLFIFVMIIINVIFRWSRGPSWPTSS